MHADVYAEETPTLHNTRKVRRRSIARSGRYIVLTSHGCLLAGAFLGATLGAAMMALIGVLLGRG